MAISDLNFFLGSKVKYVGQRSNEGKCNNLCVSSITLHPSACFVTRFGCQVPGSDLNIFEVSKVARHITAFALLLLDVRPYIFLDT